MEKHKIKIEKSARYFTLGEISSDVKTVLFVCHGYAQLADEFLSDFKSFENKNLLIVAPEGLHRFYTRGHEKIVASWMTKEDREDDINDYILFLDKVYSEVMKDISLVSSSGVENLKITVLGFSQGAATASRWAGMGKSNIDELILWCGFFPPDLQPNSISKDISLTVVTASNDKFVSPEQESDQLEKMKIISPNLKHVKFEGEHVMDVDALRKII